MWVCFTVNERSSSRAPGSPSTTRRSAVLFSSSWRCVHCLKFVNIDKVFVKFKTKIKEHSNDHKKTWEVINQIRGKKKGTIRPSFIINNQRIIERRKISQEFNNYFVSIAANMNKNLSALGEIAIQAILSFQQFFSKIKLK